MSNWSDLVEDLAKREDEELSTEQAADLLILLGARSGSYAASTALLALADVDVAVRAMSRIVNPDDDRLAVASQRFLRNLIAHSSQTDLLEWVGGVNYALGDASPDADPGSVLAEARSAVTGASEGHWVVAAPGSGKTHLLVRFLAQQLSPDETLTAAAELAAMHPNLMRERSGSIRALLATVAVRDRLVDGLAGNPRQIVSSEDVADSLLRQSAIAGEVMASIWEYPMLEPSAAAVALGAKATNREKVRTYRERAWLLGLPRGRGYLYPNFQFDPQSRDVYPEVRSVNEALHSDEDPWGIASWWTAMNDRLDSRPIELVGTPRASEIVMAASALLEPVG